MRRRLLISVVCACVGVAACSPGDGRRPAAANPDQAETGRSSAASPPSGVTLTLTPKQVVQFAGTPFEDPAVTFGSDRLRIGKNIDLAQPATAEEFRSAALAFEPVEATLCISRAELAMRGDSTDDSDEVRAYPSAALSLAEGRVPPNGDRPTTLLDNRPFGMEEVREDGTRIFDVTELVRLWTSGGTFPSRGKFVPVGSPIVLLLRPPALDAGSYEVQFDVAAHPPTLTVTSCADASH